MGRSDMLVSLMNPRLAMRRLPDSLASIGSRTVAVIAQDEADEFARSLPARRAAP
jgi:hypothetical protein